MKTYTLILAITVSLIFYSCNKDSKADKYTLQPTSTFLNFPIDDETRLPRFCLWTFEENGKEYITFPNRGKEILFYDISTEQLVKKVRFEAEGDNGVGHIHSFFPLSFEHILIADINDQLFYVTDTTGVVRSKIRYNQTSDGLPLIPSFPYTITYSPLCIWGDSLYFAQGPNLQVGIPQSPYGAVMNTSTGSITPTPLKYPFFKGLTGSHSCTGGTRVSTCFDGDMLIYSHELLDTIYKLSKDFSHIEKHIVKSKYITRPKAEVVPNGDMNSIVKRACELPAYGKLIYDKYRKVYYRFVFLEAEFENEKDYLDIFHSGRKQFSIMILDKDMKVVGETVFPEYTYNMNLFFILEDGLYLSTNHIKNPGYSDDVFTFQRIDLEKRGGK